MKWYDYLAYFKRAIGKKVGWTIMQPSDGLIRAGYPLYDRQLLAFVDRFRNSVFYDSQYHKTLRHFHVKPRVNHITVGQVMLIDTEKAARAMLSLIIDGEDTQRGTWAAALQAGYLYELLKIILENDAVAE